VFVVVFVILFVDLIQRRISKVLYAKAKKLTQNTWDEALIDAITKPLSLVIWLIGFGFIGTIITEATDSMIFSFMGSMRNVGIIMALAWFVLRLLKSGQQTYLAQQSSKSETIDVSTIDTVAKLLRASVIITTGLVILQTLGYSISGLLAFGGVGGIAIGFAARDFVANLFGGLMLHMDRPFIVGDWIRSPDRDIQGSVEYIGWRMTRVRTFDKRPLYIPNSLFSNICVENPQRMGNRRLYETIGIRYDDINKVAKIVDDVREAVQQHPGIDTEQTIIVGFDRFAASSLDFIVYAFTKATDKLTFQAVKQDLLLKIADIIENRHQAEIAFPTTTVHIPKGVPATDTGLS